MTRAPKKKKNPLECEKCLVGVMMMSSCKETKATSKPIYPASTSPTILTFEKGILTKGNLQGSNLK